LYRSRPRVRAIATSWNIQPLSSGSLNEAKRGIASPRRSRAAEAAFRAGVVEHSADVVEHFAYVHAAIDELGARRLDVGHDEMESLAPSPARPR
jgi:hypothetical protein